MTWIFKPPRREDTRASDRAGQDSVLLLKNQPWWRKDASSKLPANAYEPEMPLMQPLGFHQLGSELASRHCLLSGGECSTEKAVTKEQSSSCLCLQPKQSLPGQSAQLEERPWGWHSLCFLFFSLYSKWVSKVSRDVTEREPQTWASLNFWQVWIQFWMQKFQLRCIFNIIYPQKALLSLLHCTPRGLQECCCPHQPTCPVQR